MTGSLPRPSQTGDLYGGDFLPKTNITSNVQKSYSVDVGAFGDLVFNPNQLNASIGDVIMFNFLSLNHTLTQSELYNPCNPNGQLDTGFSQFNTQNETGKFIVRFEVKTATLQFLYCSQTIKSSHCRTGMVFGLNTDGQIGQFVKNAIAVQTSSNVILFSTVGLVPVGNMTWGINTTTPAGRGNMLITARTKIISGIYLLGLVALV
ncbi:hypothetical protein FGG08_003133 [Glutinoglossum americanum]|uniref:Uncharacterized protein n=1 Tax=Glutinoglossum americanum TaxID=1670608 RepID=A0A9P8L506_9PEZI|nr:hypothetical protein FGG08_003133 [Glutinoglossum americanum]